MAHQIPDVMRLSDDSSPISTFSDDTTLVDYDLYEARDDGLTLTGSCLSFIRDWNSFDADAAMEFTNVDDDTASQDNDDAPRLFNVGNVVTSDVVVRFNGGRSEFLSEKRILSSMSGYFKHAFSSNFPVANSDVIDLGDEDNAKHIYAMLSFIHGTTYTKIHQRSAVGRNLDFHIDLYLIGEQFDIRTLRYSAATTFFKEALFFTHTPWFPFALQRVLGPDAPAMADQFLVEICIKICTEQMDILHKNERFVEMIEAGELADDEMMGKLYLALGQRVRDMAGHAAWQSNEDRLAEAQRVRNMAGYAAWQLSEDRLAEAQRTMLTAEAAMGEGPWDRSTLGGQIMAARAQNAAWAALTNLALLVPQPTWAPPPAILASQPPPTAATAGTAGAAAVLAANPPPPVSHPVARTKTSLVKTFVHLSSLDDNAC
ncbi:hypothetical protein E4T52_03903 [Aureobasidium sp. EXF-3400]|nr:hypothetical protein E4T51_06130 [Aureobasidium sp. EXF-12344]KAI4781189.1 hypothetical protein E4T52_03903 [Aureobasidium sp. EXF-3400]